MKSFQEEDEEFLNDPEVVVVLKQQVMTLSKSFFPFACVCQQANIDFQIRFQQNNSGSRMPDARSCIKFEVGQWLRS